jgi:hypothetical protein
MSRLTYRERKNLSTSTFAEPGKRKYPLPDASHARDALSRVSGNGDEEEKKQVRGAVARRFPGILQKRSK